MVLRNLNFADFCGDSTVIFLCRLWRNQPAIIHQFYYYIDTVLLQVTLSFVLLVDIQNILTCRVYVCICVYYNCVSCDPCWVWSPCMTRWPACAGGSATNK